MYLNPSASHYRTPIHINPNVLHFHRTLPHYSPTPLRPLSPNLSINLGVQQIFFKDESNRFGLPAFKILGASWACYRAVTRAANLPLVTPIHDVKHAVGGKAAGIKLHAATDGNFGRAVAHMAGLMGVAAKIYVPIIMYEETKALIRDEGAEVVVVDGNYDAAVHRAARGAGEGDEGLLVQDDAWDGYEEVPSWVVEGYSTMMLEIDEQLCNAGWAEGPDVLVVPVGVGSLAQAVVSHYKSGERGKPPFILTVEPETAACLQASLQAGKLTTVETGDTNMCGMNCGTVSSLAWPSLRDGVDSSITVDEGEAQAAEALLDEMRINTGPCSAGTLAGLLKAAGHANKASILHEESIVVILGTEGPR